MHKVSVIVPAYNCEKTLKRCIDSIIHQTYGNIEIIIVDDGSTDNTALICDEYSNNYKNVVVIHNPNGGPSMARNAGISLSTGEYITFVDSDDYISESMYQTMIGSIGDSDVIMCNFSMFRDETENKIPLPELKHCMGDQAYDSKYILKRGCFEQDITGINMVWNKLYKADIIKNNGIFFDKNTMVGEDLLFNIDFLSKSKTVYIINDILYFYLIGRVGSIMHGEKVNLDWEAMLEQQKLKIEKAKELNVNLNVNKVYYKPLLQMYEHIGKKIKNNDEAILILKNKGYREALKYDKMLPRGIRIINFFTKINARLGLAAYKWVCKLNLRREAYVRKMEKGN